MLSGAPRYDSDPDDRPDRYLEIRRSLLPHKKLRSKKDLL
eukprot:SAG11_NODE_9330_length_921_cov_1.683698_2_plen_39_part_01